MDSNNADSGLVGLISPAVALNWLFLGRRLLMDGISTTDIELGEPVVEIIGRRRRLAFESKAAVGVDLADAALLSL